MLNDLHLNSITVGQLVSEAAKKLGLPRVVGLTDFANASVAGIARALEELQCTGGAAHKEPHQLPPGVDPWMRAFTVELVETKNLGARLPRPSGRTSSHLGGVGAPGGWQIFAPKNYRLAGPLRAAFAKQARAGGGLPAGKSGREKYFTVA